MRIGPSVRIALSVVMLWGVAAPRSANALDVTGKWLLNLGVVGGTPADFVQSGSNLSLGLALLLTGAIDAGGTFGASTGSTADCLSGLGGLIVGGTRLVGTGGSVGALCGISMAATSGERCECFDGNATSGDGCDARCQIEPC